MSDKSQQQFLDVIDRDEAERKFQAAITLAPVGVELIELAGALGRVLAEDVIATVDVPSFDRSNFDGFAVQASDTYSADEENPKRLRLLQESVPTGMVPQTELVAATAMAIATGGMIPRGADAILMIEDSDIDLSATDGETLLVKKAIPSGFGVTFSGTDIARGETVLRRGDVLTSRETGTLAAIGVTSVAVWKRPRVAIISTGDEIISPGATMRPGMIYDSNAQILADAVREAGGEPDVLGIVRDDFKKLQKFVSTAISSADVVVMSGGTSKGAGDLCYKLVSELPNPGIVAHGVALKPGKPVCLAATNGKPVAVLPGFPTSAVFTFHEFVVPVIRRMAGLGPENPQTVDARIATKVNSEIGRTEYLLVGLVPPIEGHNVAFPMGKGSGSVTTFSRADGFVTIDRNTEIVDQDAIVSVTILGRDLKVADLVVIGSHCVRLDAILSTVQAEGFRTKFLAVGSTAGLNAAKRNECDLAGIHLFDAECNEYNRPFVDASVELISGYSRCQGFVFRRNDDRFIGKTAAAAIHTATTDDSCMMINRNQGSGTRMLIDQFLDGEKPTGYAVQTKSHNAVVAAISQHRADWGIAIESATDGTEIGFLPLIDEQFDFVVPVSRLKRQAVRTFIEVLRRHSFTETGTQ